MRGTPKRQPGQSGLRSASKRSARQQEEHADQTALANLPGTAQEQSLHGQAELIQSADSRSKPTTTGPKRCMLLEAPTEIRDTILKHVLLDDIEPLCLRETLSFMSTFFLHVDDTTELSGHNIPIEHKEKFEQAFSILHTCKQLRHEAAALFFSKVVVIARDPKGLCEFLSSMGPLAEYIRTIWILFQSTTEQSRTQFSVQLTPVNHFDSGVLLQRLIPMLRQIPRLDTIIVAAGYLGTSDCHKKWLTLIRDGQVPDSDDQTENGLLDFFTAVVRCAAGTDIVDRVKLPATVIISDARSGDYETKPYTIPADLESTKWKNTSLNMRHGGRIYMSNKAVQR